MTVTSFDLLNPRIMMELKELGITEPMPPQEMAIDPISLGSNVLLVAPTVFQRKETGNQYQKGVGRDPSVSEYTAKHRK